MDALLKPYGASKGGAQETSRRIPYVTIRHFDVAQHRRSNMDASSKGKRVAFNGADRSVYDGPFEATTELVALGGQGYNSGGRLGEVMTNPMPGPSEIAICVTLHSIVRMRSFTLIAAAYLRVILDQGGLKEPAAQISVFSASLLVSLCGGSRACDDPRENTGRGGLASLMALGYAEARDSQ